LEEQAMKKEILLSVGAGVLLVGGIGMSCLFNSAADRSMQMVYSGSNPTMSRTAAVEKVSVQFMKEDGDCPKAASKKVLQVLLSVPGVVEASVDPNQLLAAVTVQKGAVPVASLKSAIEKAGFATL
jgi:copper chaperone CopZ